VDPESHEEGRSDYLGRRVARTMHWTGASWLLRKTREEQENGVLLREWLDPKPGQVICDLGSGNGYHSLPLARAVSPSGKVLAVDLQPEMLVMLRERAEEAGIENIQTVAGAIDDPHLALNSCDVVLMVDVYHELSHPVRVLGHVRRSLRPGGRVVLVEFRSEDPDVHILTDHKMSQAQVLDEMARNGFRFQDGTETLPWQHVMAFEPVKEARAIPRWQDHGACEVARGFWRALGRETDQVVQAFFLEENHAATTVAWREQGKARSPQSGRWAEELRAWKLTCLFPTRQSAAGEDRLPPSCTAFFAGPRDASVECHLVLNKGGSWRVDRVQIVAGSDDR